MYKLKLILPKKTIILFSKSILEIPLLWLSLIKIREVRITVRIINKSLFKKLKLKHIIETKIIMKIYGVLNLTTLVFDKIVDDILLG